MARSIPLTTVGSVRQGYTPLRGLTSLNLGGGDLILWTRHCLVYHGGALLRELTDTVLVVKAGDLAGELIVDPLADTRVLKGDIPSAGAHLVRYLAQVGDGTRLTFIELKNTDFNPESRTTNVVPSEYLKLDLAAIDSAPAALITPEEYTLARGATADTALSYGYGTLTDWFAVVCINLNEIQTGDYCDRLMVRAKRSGAVVLEWRLFIPRPSVPSGSLMSQQLILGMELTQGLTDMAVGLERGGIQLVSCFTISGFRLTSLCQKRVDGNAPGMKVLRLREMLESLHAGKSSASASGYSSNIEGGSVRDGDDE